MIFAFISRHIPTERQYELAEEQGHTLTHIGDTDAFTVNENWVHQHGNFDGVIVVHPAAAMRLANVFVIGVFENSNRASIGQPPKFEAVSFHVFDLRK